MKAKKLISTILSAAMVVSLMIGAPLPRAESEESVGNIASQTGEANLALNKTVTASSSYETGNTGKKFLVDGVRGTTSTSFGWTSDVYNTGDTTWVWATVDLGASYSVNRIDLYPRNDGQYAGNNFPVNFELKVSMDNKNWKVVRKLSDYPLNPKGVQSFTFETERARYVRVEGLGVKTWMYGMQLAEMEVYGDPASGLGAVNGVQENGELKVEVQNASGVSLDAQFYKRILIPADLNQHGVSAFQNPNARELPAYYPQEYGDISLSPEEMAAISQSDDKYQITKSVENSPYQRFDLEFDQPVDRELYVTWEGRTDQVVTLYVWDFTITKWVSLTSREGNLLQDIQLTGKFGSTNVQGGKAHFMVAGAQKNITEPAKKPAPNEYDFTFIWETDTQYYSRSYPNIFEKMNRWIADNKDPLKIKYVIHTGDLVQNWNMEDQWGVADRNMKILEEAGIPYGVVSGNHDVNHNVNDYEYYWKYFSRERFAGQPWYGGDLSNNRHHYDLISAGGMNFVILYLGVYGRLDQQTVDWANSVLSKYKDRYAIVGTHAYIEGSGKYGVNGKEIMEKVVAPNENVFMVVSGHYHGAFYNVKRINGKVVYEVLSDYQEGPEGGLGYIRLLQFDAKNKRMYMNTYSPYKDDYNFFADDKEQATFPLDTAKGDMTLMTDRFGISTEWNDELLGTLPNVQTGPASIKLEPDAVGNANEWFVKLIDSNGTATTSEMWRFQELAYLDTASVDGDKLVLRFDKPLADEAAANPADFSVQVQGKPTVVRSVYATGNEVLLTLSQAVLFDRTVTITYTPRTEPLKDYAGYTVKGITNIPVTNLTKKPGRAFTP
ncbi:discoidin domain-containing protein [Paenibacillus sp. CC-CFT747]|nr:discoidin domain-containing protein [Paenibacillus sp. CC-CFT747]